MISLLLFKIYKLKFFILFLVKKAKWTWALLSKLKFYNEDKLLNLFLVMFINNNMYKKFFYLESMQSILS